MTKIINIFIIASIFFLSAEFCAADSTIESFIAGAQEEKEIDLSLDDCIKMALENNSEIKIKSFAPRIERANMRKEKGAFDPALSFDWEMESDTAINQSFLASVGTLKTRTGDFNLGYDQKLPTGTQIEVDLDNTYTKSNLNTQKYNPQYDSKLAFTLTQPLLKGSGEVVNKADFLIARNNEKKSREEFTLEVMKALSGVKKSYYNFQYALEKYKVAETSLKRVKSLHDTNSEKYSKGLASNVDMLESESEVARFEQLLLSAEEDLRKAEDELKYATNIIDDPKLWNAKITVTHLLFCKEETADLTSSLRSAFKNRPDYEAAKIDLKNKDISVAYNKNQNMPTVDLKGSYGLNGLDDTYRDDLETIKSGNYPDWFAGVSISVPFFSDEGRGKYEKAKLEKKQAILSFKRLEQKIMLEARDAVRKMEINGKKIEAAKKNKEAAEKNYEAQDKRFKAGLVSTHDIINYQERLALAQTNFIESIVSYNAALIDLELVEGSTLIKGNITVDKE